METIGLYVNPDLFDPERLASVKLAPPGRGANYQVPVFFDGPDLHEVSKVVGAEPEFVVKIFCDQLYTIVAIGFLPGFPYMKGLPQELMAIPRRGEPRIKVEAGSIGIAAGQAGIYPQESPGGWNLIGVTPLKIADRAKNFFPLNPGDTINFVEVQKPQFEALKHKTLLDYAND